MDALTPATGGRGCRRWPLCLAALVVAGIGVVQAQVVQVPEAHLHHAEGTVAHAPQGEREWQDVQPRRVLQRGDRLWTDRGSRAELQAGGHALRMDGQTQIVLDNVADTATQVSLTQGTLAATVAGLQPGDEFEVGTPNLALRARTEGDFRIDVDPKEGTTRVAVLTGVGVVYGEKGEAMEIRAGQRVTFRARNLARVQQGAFAATDAFDQWAAARRRGEPTVRLPRLAQSAPTPPPSSQLVHRGPDLVIAGPASALPGARPSAGAKVLPPAPAVPPVAKAQPIPTVPAGPALPAAVPLRVNAQAVAPAAQAAAAQAQEDRRAEERRRAVAARRAEDEKRAAQAKRDREVRRVEAARKAEETRRLAAARKGEEARRVAAERKADEARRVAAAKKAEEARRVAARKAADEQRLAAARKAEEARQAEARRQQLARLQEQARREEQSVQARREEQRRREEQTWREERARREEQSRREETARREEAMRLRAVADEARRDQERREQEVWLRQRQQVAPSRPVPMGVPIGVPARRVS